MELITSTPVTSCEQIIYRARPLCRYFIHIIFFEKLRTVSFVLVLLLILQSLRVSSMVFVEFISGIFPFVDSRGRHSSFLNSDF